MCSLTNLGGAKLLVSKLSWSHMTVYNFTTSCLLQIDVRITKGVKDSFVALFLHQSACLLTFC